MPATDRPAQVSHFMLDEQLGAGGVAVVYRALDLRLGRRVALKFLRPGLLEDPVMRQRLMSEARAASTLDHPNICTIFGEACTIVPEAFDSWYLLGMCYRRMNDPGRARNADIECIEAAQKRVRAHPEDTRAWTMGAAVLAEVGEPDRALDWVARALAVDPEETIIRYNAACVYSALGKTEEALDCLEVAAERGSVSREWMSNDPDLDTLRDHPRFVALLERTSPTLAGT